MAKVIWGAILNQTVHPTTTVTTHTVDHPTDCAITFKMAEHQGAPCLIIKNRESRARVVVVMPDLTKEGWTMDALFSVQPLPDPETVRPPSYNFTADFQIRYKSRPSSMPSDFLDGVVGVEEVGEDARDALVAMTPVIIAYLRADTAYSRSYERIPVTLELVDGKHYAARLVRYEFVSNSGRGNNAIVHDDNGNAWPTFVNPRSNQEVNGRWVVVHKDRRNLSVVDPHSFQHYYKVVEKS